MEPESRQLLMTAAWMFARHGRADRALRLCRALLEDDPGDGVVAAVCADLLLADGQPQAALDALRGARAVKGLERAQAMLEGRALAALGRRDEAERRWRRYVREAHGGEREWVAGN